MQRIEELFKQKHHFIAKEFMGKINKKGTYTSVLDRFQNNEGFRAMLLRNNWNDTPRCIVFGKWIVVQTITTLREPFFAWARSRSKSTDYTKTKQLSRLILEKLEWQIFILHNWRGSTQRHHQTSAEKHASGNREPSLMMIHRKPTGGTSISGNDQDGHGMMKSDTF